jgi:hypothetical protein
MKTENVYDDIYIEFLLSSGINLEYYDNVIWSGEYIKMAIKTKSFMFWSSGLTMTLENGVKRTILFIWEKYYDLPSAQIKMKEILDGLTEDDLEDISKHTLKQTLKRIRNTNINLN